MRSVAAVCMPWSGCRTSTFAPSSSREMPFLRIWLHVKHPILTRGDCPTPASSSAPIALPITSPITISSSTPLSAAIGLVILSALCVPMKCLVWITSNTIQARSKKLSGLSTSSMFITCSNCQLHSQWSKVVGSKCSKFCTQYHNVEKHSDSVFPTNAHVINRQS